LAICADTPEENSNLRQKAGLTFPVLSDRDLDAIHHYDLALAERGEDGHEAGGPGEFLIDSGGTIRWRKLTELHPSDIQQAAKGSAVRETKAHADARG